MSSLKTTISINKDILDEKQQYVPAGNYYFTIKEMKEDLVIGDLFCKGEYGEFIFKYKNVIKMMAIAQSRLARRANLIEPHMPNYISPVASPQRLKYPIVNNYTLSKNLEYKNTRYVKEEVINIEKEKCTICLDIIENNEVNLECKHIFHKNCIEGWNKHKNTCPVCRKPIKFVNKKKYKTSKYVVTNRYTSASLTNPTNYNSINTIIRNGSNPRRRNTIIDMRDSISDIRRRYNLRPRNY